MQCLVSVIIGSKIFLVMSCVCVLGNLGNIVIIIVPAICAEEGSPFGDHNICSSKGLSYSSFSMAVSSALSDTLYKLLVYLSNFQVILLSVTW